MGKEMLFNADQRKLLKPNLNNFVARPAFATFRTFNNDPQGRESSALCDRGGPNHS